MENKKYVGFKLKRLHLFIPHNGYVWLVHPEYNNTDCDIHVVDFINWCMWKIENNQDFFKKCEAIRRIGYAHMGGNFPIVSVIIRKNLKIYGIWGVYSTIENLIDPPSIVIEPAERDCDCYCDEEERDEDCGCECHSENESDSDEE